LERKGIIGTVFQGKDTTMGRSIFDSFKIQDRESCAKAIRNGGIAAMISAGITGIFGIAGFFANTTNRELSYFMDPWILIDVVLIVILGIFVFLKSRIAATLLVIYFVVAKIIMWMELGSPKGLLMTIIFFLYYVTAMIGTYLWHGKYRDATNQRLRYRG
jgi:hypothetical protein